MGWVVYCKASGEMLRYYDTESKARSQVNGHNTKLFWSMLQDTNDLKRKEWSHCEWSQYEEEYKTYYQINKAYILTRSGYR